MTTRRIKAGLALVALGAGLLATSSRGAGEQVREGGMFRIALQRIDSTDPALAYEPTSWALLDPTCARLLNYPDKPPPAGLRAVPEVAAGYPTVSKDRRTYTFRLRRGFRFSDGTPVRADAFARAINRTLAPGLESPATQYTRDIIGADDVLAGRAQAAAGVVARGDRLSIRLVRPASDFPARMTMPFFCAVPPTLPADPEGIGAFPGAGPYYIAEYRPGERVVLRRNRFYRGKRPHHVDGFVVDMRASSPEEILDQIERGETDWSSLDVPGRTAALDPQRRLVAKYGINRSRFFVQPGLTFNGLIFNASRPLFRNNTMLRRAINFAIDRRAIRRALGGRLTGYLTDQYLPPTMPGFKNRALYPLKRVDLRRARMHARGHVKSGKAVFYASNTPLGQVIAQVVKRDLAKIGLDIEIKPVPRPVFARLAIPGEPWDLAAFAWAPDYIDPFSYLNLLLDGRFIGAQNLSRFNSTRFNRLLRSAAPLQGPPRYAAYGEVDIQLARDAAPMVAVAYLNEVTFVSGRVDPRCIVLRPALDLTAVCLKR